MESGNFLSHFGCLWDVFDVLVVLVLLILVLAFRDRDIHEGYYLGGILVVGFIFMARALAKRRFSCTVCHIIYDRSELRTIAAKRRREPNGTDASGSND